MTSWLTTVIPAVGVFSCMFLGAAGTTHAAADAVSSLEAKMTGAADGVNTTGSGVALVSLYGQNKLCYSLKVSGLNNTTVAHIHKGKAGVNGPVVVPLQLPGNGSNNKCVLIKTDLFKSMMQNPSNYYVNVHTKQYPNGAIRGQLMNS